MANVIDDLIISLLGQGLEFWPVLTSVFYLQIGSYVNEKENYANNYWKGLILF